MPVHANSKIDLWVNSFSPTFYDSITSKENWTYINYNSDASALAAWEAYFTNLMVRINAWAADTTAPSRTSVSSKNLVQYTYTYVSLHYAFGTDFTDIGNFQSLFIYDIGGFVPDTIARAVDWYNDMELIGYTSPRMIADLAAIDIPAYQTIETARLATLSQSSLSVSSGFSYSALFEPLPASVAPKTKTELATYIFITLGYKNTLIYVTGIQGMTLPPYI